MAAWRPGNWCIGAHPFLTWLPRIERDVGYFSSWWLWFEVSYADGAKIEAEAQRKLRFAKEHE